MNGNKNADALGDEDPCGEVTNRYRVIKASKRYAQPRLKVICIADSSHEPNHKHTRYGYNI